MRTKAPVHQYHHRRRIAWILNEANSSSWQSSQNGGIISPLKPLTRPVSRSSTYITGCDWSEKAQEYSQNSSLHGLRYIGDTKLHYLERVFWIISFLLAVTASAYFITNIFQKWTEMPVIMTLSPTATSLTSIPFPAVTICNMNNVRRTVAERILQTAKDNPKDRYAKLEETLLRERCNYNSNGNYKTDNRTGEWSYVKKFMIKASQPCHDMLAACFWHKEPRNCNELFSPILTDEGICCSFNTIKSEFIFNNPKELTDLNVTFQFPSVDWNSETGFPSDTPPDYIPWRPWGTGSHLGLTLVLDAEQDQYYCSSEASLGFKVLLHNPVETPKMSAFGSAVSSGKETRLDINPRIMTSTPQVIDISINKRNCFFIKERKLRFYRVYTERNCNAECEANFTLHFCNCVQYYMPKDSLTRICGKRDLKCALNAQHTMERLMAHRTLNTTLPINLTNLGNCECLPSCFDLDYTKVESTSTLTEKVNISEYLAGRKPHYFKRNMAVLHMFFTEDQFTGIQRGVLFGFTEFLSNTGGLLGLFMGFSFLSAVEALYFLSLRIWCSINRQRQDENKINKNKITGHYKKALFPYME